MIPGMVLGIDHVLIAVESFDHAAEAYRRLGFQVMRGGEHPGMGTANALLPLADGARQAAGARLTLRE